MNLDGLSLKLSLEPRKKISECVLTCAGVRKRWKCAVVDGVLLTPPSVTERLLPLVADPLCLET